ncbi:kinase-like domain-containing protein, partial [Polychytrium aggregatum]|uniref:kinase-like domain-containing protein n=1 Tax=Polychytrium aggregatum TaxID=110093 RepID=UPI0022FECA4C
MSGSSATACADPPANKPSWYISPSDITDRSAVPIGRGGFGEVYSGRYYGSKVAIKQLLGTCNKRELVDYRREIDIWKELSHPHILRLLGACDKSDDGTPIVPFMVSPFMPNGTLRDYVSDPDSPRPLEEKLHLLFQVASGMSYLHGKHVVHGDLKAANVLLDEARSAVVSDFGLSRTKHTSASMDRNRTYNTIVGTEGYMAPELLDDENPSGTTMKTDVYAFAITMYEALNDAQPIWVTDNGQPMLSQVIEKQVRKGKRPKQIDGIPDDVWTVIESCWSQAPNERPSFPAILETLNRYDTVDLPPPPGPAPVPVPVPVPVPAPRWEPEPKQEPEPIQTPISPPVTPSPTPSAESGSYPGVPRLILQKARRGDANACVQVAKMLSHHKFVTDPVWTQAASFFQVAAEQQQSEAYFYLGWMHLLGVGVEQSDLDALTYLQEVCSQPGDHALRSIATHLLGWMHYLGRGTNRDQQTGVQLVRDSQTEEFPLGEHECLAAFGLAPSESPAAIRFFELLQLGAERDWVCKHLLAVCIICEFGNSIGEEQVAVAIFEQLAQQGHSDSQFWLGRCYFWGWGVASDRKTALRWFIESADRGNPYGEYMAGWCYEYGHGTAKDGAKAAEYFRKSADQGNRYGQYGLGDCFSHGDGVAKDADVADRWYRKAADQGWSPITNF